MAIIDELVSILGYKIEGQENLRDFKRGMSDAEKSTKGLAQGITSMARGAVAGMAALGAAVAGATGSMFALANAAAGPLDEIAKLAGRTGESVEAIQEWGFAAEQGGASAAAMNSAIETMRRRLAQAARGAGAAKTALDDYGISATDAEGNVRKATDVMAELADRFQDMDEGQRLDIARALGIDMKMVSVLAQGNDEIERLRKVARDAGLVFTREDTESAEAYNDAMNLLMRTVRAMRDRIAIDLLPTLMQMVGGMQDWLNANREVIAQNVGAFLERIARHARTLSEQGGAMADAMGRWIWVFGAVALAAWPLARVITAVAIAFDDFMTWWSDGGESFLGAFSDMLQSWGMSSGAADTLTTVAGALALFAAIKPGAFLRMVGGLGKLLLAIGGLKMIGAAGVMTALGTSIGIFAAAALAASWKIALVVAAIWALVGAYKALRSVDFKAPTAEFNEGSPSLQDRGRAEEERLGDDFDEQMKNRGGSRILDFLFGGIAAPRDEQPTVQPQSFGMMGGPDLTPAIGGTVTDNRDQSQNYDFGGITVNAQGADGRGLADAMVDQLRLRAATIAGQSPVTP